MAEPADMDRDGAIQEFLASTNATHSIARQYLDMTDGNVQAAVQAFLLDEETDEDAEDEVDTPFKAAVPSQSSDSAVAGGRRLGDGTELASSTPSSSSAPSRSSQRTQQLRKKFSSLAEMQSGGQSGSGPAGGDDDDSDKEQEFFTGGDKSGLAVQDPRSRDHIQRLLETARRNAPRPPRGDDGEDAPARQSAFTGSGQTLGGDDVESQVIPAPNGGAANRRLEMVERTLHLWADGFSVDDGPLYRYDDPANSRTLDMINSGSAPLDIMNVESGQAVDVRLEAHRGENYVQPKQKYKPFTGGGQRLGSPTPSAAAGGASSSTATASSTTSAAGQSQSQPSVEVDDSQPIVTLQIRLADGTRLPSRFNASHTIGDVYAFVDRASTDSSGRAYSLATTFPTKELTDKAQVLGDMAEFKRGGVVVQKWS